MSWAHISGQSAHGQGNSTTNGASATFGNASTVGNAVIVAFSAYIATPGAVTITDNGATPNTYTLLAGPEITGSLHIWVYGAVITSLPVSGNIQVSCSLANGNNYGTCCIDEYSFNSGTLVAGQLVGLGTAAGSLVIQPGQMQFAANTALCYCVGAMSATNTTTWTPSTNFTLRTGIARLGDRGLRDQ